MNQNDLASLPVEPGLPSRRTVVAGALWATPVVMGLAATPAFAASGDAADLTIAVEGIVTNVGKSGGSPPTKRWIYGEINAQLSNTWPSESGATFTATVTFTRIRDELGNPVSDGVHTVTATPATVAKYGHARLVYESVENFALGDWQVSYTVSATSEPGGQNIKPGPVTKLADPVAIVLYP